MHTTAVRVFIAFALVSLVGFFVAGATAGDTLPVLIGSIGLFAAGASFITVIDAAPRAPRSAPTETRSAL